MAYSTNWQFTAGEIGIQPVVESSSVLRHPLGMVRRASDKGDNQNGEGEFIYLRGATSTAVGSWVLYSSDDHSTSLLVADDVGPVAISMSANGAGSYGWYQTKGKAVGKALADFADNATPYLTSTPGSVDDAVVAGDRIKNCRGASAVGFPATGMAEFEIDHPFVDDGMAA